MEMEPPDLRNPPTGCRFVDRCPFAVEECHEGHPTYREPRADIESACIRAEEAQALREQARRVAWNREEIEEVSD